MMLSICKCEEQELDDDGTTFPSNRHIYGMMGCVLGTLLIWIVYRKFKSPLVKHLSGWSRKSIQEPRPRPAPAVVQQESRSETVGSQVSVHEDVKHERRHHESNHEVEESPRVVNSSRNKRRRR